MLGMMAKNQKKKTILLLSEVCVVQLAISTSCRTLFFVLFSRANGSLDSDLSNDAVGLYR